MGTFKRFGQNTFIWKKLSLFKEVAVFLYNQFQNSFFGIVKYWIFPAFLVQNQRHELCGKWTFKRFGHNTFIWKKLSLFKEVVAFSRISFTFFRYCEIFLGICLGIFGYSWLRNSCMVYLNCESTKEMARIRLFEKSCHYLKKFQFYL